MQIILINPELAFSLIYQMRNNKRLVSFVDQPILLRCFI